MIKSATLQRLGSHFEVRASSSGHIPSMEGMRGLAMLLVFIAHYYGLSQPWLADGTRTNALWSVVSAFGSPAVSLFFLISGFGIYGSLIRKPFRSGQFIRRRLQRIYPPFLAVLLLYLVLSLLFPSESKLPAEADAAAVYIVQNVLLLPGLFDIEPIISVAWTLSYELLFYITAPLLVSLLSLQARTRGFRIVLFALLSVGIFAYCIAVGGPIDLVMFLAGMILYECLPRQRGAALGWIGFGALVAGFGIAFLIEPRHVASIPRSAWLYGAFFITCAASFSGSFPVSNLFSWTPLRWLGNMSYSYYLLHGVTLKGIFLALGLLLPPQLIGPGTAVFWLLLPVALAITLTTSALLYLSVERSFSLPRWTPVRARSGVVDSVPAPVAHAAVSPDNAAPGVWR